MIKYKTLLASLQATQTDSHDSLLLEPTCLLKYSEPGPWVIRPPLPSPLSPSCWPLTGPQAASYMGVLCGLFDSFFFFCKTESGCENDNLCNIPHNLSSAVFLLFTFYFIKRSDDFSLSYVWTHSRTLIFFSLICYKLGVGSQTPMSNRVMSNGSILNHSYKQHAYFLTVQTNRPVQCKQ